MQRFQKPKSTTNYMGYHKSGSFLSKTRIILSLLGILPFLITIYLFFYSKIDVNDTIFTFSVLALFSILTGFLILRRFSDQLIVLSNKTSDASHGESNNPIIIKADQELIDIADNFNLTLDKYAKVDRELKVQSIQLMSYARDLSQSYKKAKEEEELRGRLNRYVGAHLVEKLANSKKGVFLENERKEITILFADIRSFTSLSERMPAEDVISMLNQYFDTVVDIVFKNNGVLDKFVGDQLMAVFGLIPSAGSAPYDATRTALEIQEATERLMELRGQQGKETFQIGIGINTGRAIVGNVGSKNRMDYTVVGDSVNVAARLQQMAKGGEVVIAKKTHDSVKEKFSFNELEKIFVKGKNDPVLCYNVLK